MRDATTRAPRPRRTFAAAAARLVSVLLAGLAAAETAPTWFVVVAADRGFAANRAVERHFEAYRASYPQARLFFATARHQKSRIEALLASIPAAGPARLVVLPLFVSEEERPFRDFLADLAEVRQGTKREWTVEVRPAFGASVTAADILEDRIADGSAEGSSGRLVVLGCCATDPASEAALGRRLEALVETRGLAHGFEGVDVAVLHGRASATRQASNEAVYEKIVELAARRTRLLVAPFFLGYRADRHMSIEAAVESRLAPYRIDWAWASPDRDGRLVRWLARSSAAALPPTRQTLGVVVVAHGADRVWNDELRAALAPVAERYDVVTSFNMMDPELLQDAVDALEARGKTHIVLYRLFALERSFADGLARALGEDRPTGEHGRGSSSSRLRSRAALVSFGGLEDHPLFADALLERALSASRGEPEREVVLLVAHGAGEDEDDAHWREVLASLGRRIQAKASRKFHDVVGVTLREDWPEKRKACLEAIERLVARHRAAGRRVLAVEARINGPGPTRRLLGHLDIPIEDEGLVPHENLARIVIDDIETYLRTGRPPSRSGPAHERPSGSARGPGLEGDGSAAAAVVP